MSAPYTPDLTLETRLSRKLMDVFIRAGLVFALAVLCYRIFSPFLVADGVGPDPGGDALSGASEAGAQDGRQTGAVRPRCWCWPASC